MRTIIGALTVLTLILCAGCSTVNRDTLLTQVYYDGYNFDNQDQCQGDCSTPFVVGD